MAPRPTVMHQPLDKEVLTSRPSSCNSPDAPAVMHHLLDKATLTVEEPGFKR
ncbi:hypothetical protein BCR37DRAFT_380112 [Protomyces lactucae-debilis]|uniref:Uncharacterized protein n=1 Tax=Protomyces lactucae-debilis TaxID=2754530 RepID=A0A1Y2FDZ9_PROLT|nr:uncharacterized protein BCR37DRAFT_380112 [Protomyces lactucae-debilis]ORY82158.1 hypothetical protein BCR37DRAFT_380112 [Protomyces lactucae-debilis]